MARTVTCADCGAERKTIYKNTRYCISCRLLRDLGFLEAEALRRCISTGCNNSFLPTAKKDIYCGECAGIMASEQGTCLYCKDTDRPLFRGMGICTGCVRSPAERPRVIKGLRSGQAARKTSNAAALKRLEGVVL